MKETTISTIMMREPVTMGPDDTLDLANDLMSLGRIRHLPILDGERIVGVLSQRDLFRSTIATSMGFGHEAEKTLLKTIRIKEVMCSPVITACPGATVKEAAVLMADKKIGCLPVVLEGRLVGLVTQTDILRYVVNL
jgi:CBS domain-containing protein